MRIMGPQTLMMMAFRSCTGWDTDVRIYVNEIRNLGAASHSSFSDFLLSPGFSSLSGLSPSIFRGSLVTSSPDSVLALQ